MKVKQILKNWDYDRIEPKLAVSTTLWGNSQHSPKTSRLLLMLFVSSSWSPDVFVSFTFSLPISKQYRHSSFCTWVPYIPPRTGYGIFLVKTWELEGIYQHSLLSAKLRIVNETWIVIYIGSCSCFEQEQTNPHKWPVAVCHTKCTFSFTSVIHIIPNILQIHVQECAIMQVELPR